MKCFINTMLVSACLTSLWASTTPEIYANIETQYTAELSAQSASGTAIPSEYQNGQQLSLTLAELGVYYNMTPTLAVAAEIQHARADRNQLSLEQQFDDGQTSYSIWSDLHPIQSHRPLEWSRAELCYNLSKKTTIVMGLLRLPEISSERSYYKPYLGSPATNRSIGGLLTNQGRHIGVATIGKVGSWDYQLSFWQQTPLKKIKTLPQEGLTAESGITSLKQFEFSYTTGEDADNQPIAQTATLSAHDFYTNKPALGFSSRFCYQQQLPGTIGGGYVFGLGVSVAPLNKPLLVNTIVAFEDDESAVQYGTVNFHNLAQWAIDSSVVLSNIQINLGYQSQHLINNENMYYPQGLRFFNAPTAFDVSGHAGSLWVEVGCLIGAGNYELLEHYGAIAGVNIRPQDIVFEITGRYGMEHYRNVSALLEHQGFIDFSTNADMTAPSEHPLVSIAETAVAEFNQATILSIDNTGTYAPQVVQRENRSYEYKKTGWQITGAVFLSPQFCLRLQYQTLYHSYCKHHSGDAKNETWHDSLYAHKVSTIKFGGQYAY